MKVTCNISFRVGKVTFKGNMLHSCLLSNKVMCPSNILLLEMAIQPTEVIKFT